MTAAILVFSLARIVAFGATEMAVLLISIIVAWLTSHARQTIPNTTVSFSSKHIFAFWGIIWLGPGGGTILAAAASVANIRKRGLSWRRAVPAVCADVVSAFLAALVFFVASGNAATLQGKTAAGSMFVSDNIALAACLMAAAHYLVHSSLSYLFRRLDDDRAVGEVLHEALMFPAVAYLIATVAALSLSAVFSHFGVEFGLVILPLAVIGNLAYQIHIRRLAQKTRQVSDTSRIHLATVEALATAIDAREQVGMGHVLRTQIYATKIREILGLSENDIDALRTGSLLHGIGKVAVPDHILN